MKTNRTLLMDFIQQESEVVSVFNALMYQCGSSLPPPVALEKRWCRIFAVQSNIWSVSLKSLLD